MNQIKKFIYQNILSRNLILPFSKGHRFIFLLHDISEKNSPQHNAIYSTTPSAFIIMLDWMQRHFKLVSLDDLMNPDFDEDTNSNLATLTFDDGFLSVKEVAYPIMHERNVPFTVFLNQQAIEDNWIWCSNILMALNQKDEGYIKRIYDHFNVEQQFSFVDFIKDPITILSDEKYLNDDYDIFQNTRYQKEKIYLDKEDVLFLQSKGITLGNHTKSHKQLSTCSDAVIDDEILTNKNYLEDLLKEKIGHFAIPFGFHTTYNDHAISVSKTAHDNVYNTEKNKVINGQHLVPRIGLQCENAGNLYSYVNYQILRNKL